jgi:carboxypeptidase Q
MKRIVTIIALCGLLGVAAAPALGQTLAVDDPVLRGIWQQALEHSQLETIAHQLLDVNGPRLTGSPQDTKAHEWAVATFKSWGIDAKNEQWGTWRSWQRGVCHFDLLEPWVKTLEGNLMSWSPGTRRPVTGEVAVIPDVADSNAFKAWLPSIKGKFVAVSFPEPTGRPNTVWEANALPDTYEKMNEARNAARQAFNENLRRAGFSGREGTARLTDRLAEAGAAGILTMSWANLWMVRRTFGASTDKIPSLVLSLEDYTLLYRLTQSGHTPKVRLEAEAEFLGDVPVYNTVAMIRGSEKPDEYIVLMGHLDSWDTSTGACDNGTGSMLAMEALRIIKQVYPNPKRTIVACLWGSEEQGLNGSAAFVQDHPEIRRGLQAAFNQDNGTGRIVRMSASGFVEAGPYLAKWLSLVPEEVGGIVALSLPGMPSGGGSDHASFVASGLPAFSLGAHSWEYGYTWHTEIDTYDKIVFDELRNNAVLEACLAYLASEEADTIPRTKRIMPLNPRTGQPQPWPAPRTPIRKGGH